MPFVRDPRAKLLVGFGAKPRVVLLSHYMHNAPEYVSLYTAGAVLSTLILQE